MILTVLLSLLLVLGGSADAQTLGQGLKHARELESRKDLEGALIAYRKLHARYPGRIDVLFKLADLLTRTGRHAESIDLLRARLVRSPRDFGARLRLGDALFASGGSEAAV